jgi:hypothetical protein
VSHVPERRMATMFLLLKRESFAMTDALRLILEDTDGTQLETSCTRFAVIWQGKEVWIQQDGRGQLLIGVDVEEGDAEYANLLLRPLATNLVSLQLEMEPADMSGDDEDGHVHGPDCNHD